MQVIERQQMIRESETKRAMAREFTAEHLPRLIQLLEQLDSNLADQMGDGFRPILDQVLWHSFRAGWNSGRCSR